MADKPSGASAKGDLKGKCHQNGDAAEQRQEDEHACTHDSQPRDDGPTMTTTGLKRLLVLGGGSEIASAFVQRCAAANLEQVVLAARSGGSVDEVAVALASNAGHVQVDIAEFDGTDTANHGRSLRDLDETFGPFDTVVVAFGQLGDPFTIDIDPNVAAQLAEINFGGAVSSSLAALNILRGEPNARLIIFSSIAGVRPRVGNLVYGSAKAGLDAFAMELRAPARAVGVDVVVVRPGFVRGRMTAGLEPAPMATTPHEVAADMFDGIGKGRSVIHSPAALAPVGAVLRNLPGPIWRRIAAR